MSRLMHINVMYVTEAVYKMWEMDIVDSLI